MEPLSIRGACHDWRRGARRGYDGGWTSLSPRMIVMCHGLTVSAISLLLAACGGGGSTVGVGHDKYTSVAQCPSGHVVSCTHKHISTTSGKPNDVISDDCTEILSNGSSIAEAQAAGVRAECDPSHSTTEDTYTLGSGCSHGDEKQGCLNGSQGAGFCQINWVLNDDPTVASEYASACTAAGSSAVSP